VWQALVDPKVIDEWGGGPAKMDDKVGTAFTLWGGDIFGKNVEVRDEKRLVQEWYSGDWPAPSVATFDLAEETGGTRLTLTHTGVPDEEAAEIDEGWDSFYLGPLQSLLEA
jgi:activator of HSP90 ATPase